MSPRHNPDSPQTPLLKAVANKAERYDRQSAFPGMQRFLRLIAAEGELTLMRK
jgi:hypothetical protein